MKNNKVLLSIKNASYQYSDADEGEYALKNVSYDFEKGKVYAIRGGKDEYLVPAVPAFVKAIDINANTIDIHVWEGLGSHEN